MNATDLSDPFRLGQGRFLLPLLPSGYRPCRDTAQGSKFLLCQACELSCRRQSDLFYRHIDTLLFQYYEFIVFIQRYSRNIMLK